MEFLIKRKTIFVALFLAFVTLAGFSQLASNVDAAANPNATIPPPGGTLPLNSAGIQLLHLAPFATDSAVDAVINGGNGNTTYSNVGLGQSTGGYLPVPAGTVTGIVTPTIGGGSFSFSETLIPNIEYTTAVIGGANGWPVEFLTLKDTTSDPAVLSGKIRIVHAAPFAQPPAINTAVNVVDQSGNSIDASFEGLLYAESTAYLELPVGFYDWKVNLPNTTTLVDLPPFKLYSEAVVTIYIVGDATVQQPAGLYVIQELGKEPTIMYMAVMINS